MVAEQAFPSSLLPSSDARDKKHFQREDVFIVKAQMLQEMRDTSVLPEPPASAGNFLGLEWEVLRGSPCTAP